MSAAKTKALNEAQFLQLLQKVLSKATNDPILAGSIYDEVTKEVRLVKSLQSFEKFCEKGALPDAEEQTVASFQSELVERFGDAKVEVTPDEDGTSLAVEIELPDRIVSSTVRIDPTAAAAQEEPDAPYVPFVVSLPEDPELVWVLARRENLGPDEAARGLSRIAQEFWETKKGQELQRKGTEKTFAEFITHVPAAMLGDGGLKRHYKDPETRQMLRLLTNSAETEALAKRSDDR